MLSFSASGVFTSKAAIRPNNNGARVACVLKNSKCRLIARSRSSSGASLYNRFKTGVKVNKQPSACWRS